MINVAAYTGGENVPSARFRVRQYIPALREQGIAITEFPAWFGSYPPANRALRPLWAASTLACRLPSIARSYAYDAVLLQREMLSTFTSLEPLTHKPRILDVDDAIWLNGSSDFARRLARISQLVICGNSYIQEYFSRVNRNTFTVPTAVNTKRFLPKAKVPTEEVVIGWSGVSASYHELDTILPSLETVLRKHRDVKLCIMSDRPPNWPGLQQSGKLQFVRWSPSVEVDVIRSFDIGIMPLADTEWNRGKCSYKMLLYMACGIAPLVSPVGMNADVLEVAGFRLAPRTSPDWVDCLSLLIQQPSLRMELAARAREVAVNHYSIEEVVPSLTLAFQRVAR